MSYLELNRLQNIARLGGGHDHDDDECPTRPSLWGPASWWRAGLVVMAVLILSAIALSIF